MGERAKNIGEEAEDKVWVFLSDLGYEFEDTNIEVYDIDGIAKSPENEPELGLAKPSYSPNGLVAFEVKEPNVTTRKIDKFAKKISKYNNNNVEKLTGGIYIVDHKISARMLNHMKKKNIWGWGQKRTKLYNEKKNAFFYWSKKDAFVIEKRIDKHNSYLQIATPPPTDSSYLIYFTVICDNLEEKLSPKIVKRLMNKVRDISITPLVELGIMPINVYFEFYSIGGLATNLVDETNKYIINRWKEEGISVNVGKFTDFRTFVTL